MSTNLNRSRPFAIETNTQPTRPDPSWTPNVPNQARIYDYLIGGKDNFAVDREAAEELIRRSPGLRKLALANRSFLGRAVRYLASLGIRQYIDVGTGLPGPGPVHEIARRLVPDARVVYSDVDSNVVVHGEALLADGLRDGSRTIMVRADLRDPATVVDRHKGSRVHNLIKWDEPVAVLLVAVLHFISDEDDPAAIIARICARLPPGSFLAISHVTAGNLSAEDLTAARRVYDDSGGVFPRNREQIERLCLGLDLVRPGLVPVRHWRPDQRPFGPPEGADCLAAVGSVVRSPQVTAREPATSHVPWGRYLDPTPGT